MSSPLANACDIFRRHCVAGIEADTQRCRDHIEGATAIVTTLAGTIGYEAAQTAIRRISQASWHPISTTLTTKLVLSKTTPPRHEASRSTREKIK